MDAPHSFSFPYPAVGKMLCVYLLQFYSADTADYLQDMNMTYSFTGMPSWSLTFQSVGEGSSPQWKSF